MWTSSARNWREVNQLDTLERILTWIEKVAHLFVWMGKVARLLGELLFIIIGGYLVLDYIYDGSEGSMLIVGGTFLAVGFMMFWKSLKQIFPS